MTSSIKGNESTSRPASALLKMDQKDRCGAFLLLLRDYLSLSTGAELVAIYDDSFRDNLEALQIASDTLGIAPTLITLPYEQQIRLIPTPRDSDDDKAVRLPRGLIAAMSAVPAILNVISASPATMVVRRAIVSQERGNKCRLAHIPGISDDILHLLLKTNLDQLAEDCEVVARAIGNSQEALIETYDTNGHAYKLKARLNGWDSEPIISSGLIPPGSWGNIPGGETFCCPPFDGVNGDICINGSVPNHSLNSDEHVVLTFRDGKLLSWRSVSRTSPAIAFFEKEQERARQRNDENWNTFAELGIGLNPAISNLTGNSIFDEKAGRTVHIAIGDNFGFGRGVVAKVHHDMVTTNPTVELDGRALISNGELSRKKFPLYALPSPIAPLPDGDNNLVYVHRSRFEMKDALLLRRLVSGHRFGCVRIASDILAERLHTLCTELLTYTFVNPVEFLRQNPTWNGAETSDLLQLLYHYRIVGYR